MGQQHGHVAFFYIKGNEQQHKPDGCHNLRVHHRQIINLIHDVTDYLLGLA